MSVGDDVAVDDPLVTLESDKASMEIPSPVAGVVKELKVAVGDQVSQGALVVILESETQAVAPKAEEAAEDTPVPPEPSPADEPRSC